MLIGQVTSYAGPVNDGTKKDLEGKGWLFCDGRAVSRELYNSLYKVIGDCWGAGDNITTFNLPDFRGYFLRGVDHGAKHDPESAKRTPINPNGKGNSGDNVGSYQPDLFKSHDHLISPDIGLWHRSFTGSDDSSKTVCTHYDSEKVHVNSSGGSETRPTNVYVEFLICYKE